MAKGIKTGGRVVGSRNKDTLPILDVFEEFDYDPAVEAIKLLKSGTLEPDVAMNAHLKLLKFKYRELSSMNINLESGPIKISFEDFIKNLKE